MTFVLAQGVLLLAFAAQHLLAHRGSQFGASLALHLAATAGYLLLVAGAARGRWRPAFAHALVLAVALRALALPLAPQLSPDVHRNVFEGRVVLEGLDPYQVAPSDPRAAHLRDRGDRGVSAGVPDTSQVRLRHREVRKTIFRARDLERRHVHLHSV